MASDKKNKATMMEPLALVDPVYQKFVKGILRAIGSTDFYSYFMRSIGGADNQIQFSNRKMIKTVDVTWVDAIEDSLEAFQTIINAPRNVIKEEELIVNVANAKKTGTEVVQHLAQHSNLVEDFNYDTGDVRPSRLMQRYREDSTELYENKIVFTALESAYQFVKIRHDALFSAMSDEFGAKLKVQSNMDSATEHVHLDMFLHIKQVENLLDTDERNSEIFGRISRMHRILGMFMNTDFAERMSKLSRVKGTIVKTNVLKKNPNYRHIVELFEFLHNYNEIGYSIKVIEQNPEVNDTLQRDIYHNILFNYLVLKGYLQDEEDRQVSVSSRGKKRTLKPKFIKEIIEELTEDYDLPDVEIRKVLIEELTKTDLMKEESAERHRLVEEQRQRKKAEEERIRQEKAAEKERLRQEKEAEKERLRIEKEKEEQRLLQERMELEIEMRRRSALFKKDLANFAENLRERLEERVNQQSKEEQILERLDYSEAVILLEEEETRRREANARLRKQRQIEKEMRRQEEERERIRQEQEAERARAEAEEQERIAMERQREKDLVALKPVILELERFAEYRGTQKLERIMEQQRQQAALEKRRLSAQSKRG